MGSFMPYKNVETLLLAMRSLPDAAWPAVEDAAAAPGAATDERLIGENVEVHNGVSDEYQQLLRQARPGDYLPRGGYGLPWSFAQAAGCPR